MELFRYVPYINNEKMKVRGFVSGFILEFNYQIEYDETQTLEKVI